MTCTGLSYRRTLEIVGKAAGQTWCKKSWHEYGTSLKGMNGRPRTRTDQAQGRQRHSAGPRLFLAAFRGRQSRSSQTWRIFAVRLRQRQKRSWPASWRKEVLEVAPWLRLSPSLADSLETLRSCSVAVHRPHRITSSRCAGRKGRCCRRPTTMGTASATAGRAAAKAGDALGLSPIALSKLRQINASTEATTAGLEQLAERGRLIRERRQAELAAEAEPDDA